MALDVSVEDRAAIQDTVGRYLWALDIGDAKGVDACFSRTARSIDTMGNVYEGEGAILRFAERFIGMQDFRGRKHLVTPLWYERDGARVNLMSYWTVTKWYTATNEMKIVSTGYSEDVFEQQDGKWLFAERRLFHFSDTKGPWMGPT
jgi:hypothetical protein